MDKAINDALVLNAVLGLTRTRSELVLENALLRQQLIVLKRQTKRPKLTRSCRWFPCWRGYSAGGFSGLTRLSSQHWR